MEEVQGWGASLMFKLLVAGWFICGAVLLGIIVSIYREVVKIERKSDWFCE
jgi:hypothetical protein